MQDETKNLILATALSFLVILVWFWLSPPPTVQPTADPATVQSDGTGASVATPQIQPAIIPATREDALVTSARVDIETSRLRGSLSLTGAQIDDLHLEDYNVTREPGSDTVTLLSPRGAEDAYYALHGWAAAAGITVPTTTSVWELEDGLVLTPQTPVTLRWENGQGLIFRQVISVDDDYMFDIVQSVENTGTSSVRLTPYGIVARHSEPEIENAYIVHHGVVAMNDGSLNEIDYDDMPDLDFSSVEAAPLERTEVTENGWIGFTDKYWMTVMVPQAGQSFTSVAKYVPSAGIYQTEVRLPAMDVPAGQTATINTALFAGAKIESTLAQYSEQRGVERLDDAIDWGWFFFLTQPMHQLLVFIFGLVGNMGWSIILLTLLIKAILFPLAYRSYVSMSKMKALQPEMQKIKEHAGDDRQKLQQEMMQLYKKEKVNPASGCLPILLQIPVFFSLYKVLNVSIEMRHAPFIAWIEDLSAPDPTSWMNLFGLLPYATPGPESLFYILSIGVWPILMGVTMWLQQKLNPAPTDATQAAIFAWMPWIFMFMLGSFASGLVIYWVANNTLTFIQQYSIMRTQGVDVDLFGNIKGSFKRKKPKADK